MVLRRLVVVCALVATALVAVPTVGAGSTQTEQLAAMETQIVREINRVRSGQGLRPLSGSAQLREAARTHTVAMLDGGFFSHTSADGTSAGDRIQRQYAPRPGRAWAIGETLFSTSGTIDARSAVSAWLASPPHRQVLLSPRFREVGLGVARAPAAGGTFKGLPTTVATADFGAR